MPDLWMPGVTRLPPTNQAPIPLGLQGKGLRLFTWHTFEAPYTYSLDGTVAMRYLHSQGSTSHFVFHPVTGAIVQALPMNVGARTLRADGPVRHTNAFGDVHAQVEVIARAARPFTQDLTPRGLDSLRRLMDFLRSWGIPDQWAWSGMTRPPATYAEANLASSRGCPNRSGHATHSKWWANDHWDPGAIANPWSLVGGGGTVKPSPAPPPRADTWPAGWIANAQTLLNELGYTDAAGKALAVDDSLGPATQHATRTYQADAGLTVDGQPGAATTASLEDTMSKIDDLLAEIKKRPTLAQIMGYRNPGKNYTQRDVHGLLRDAETTKQGVAQLQATLAKMNGQQVDVNELARLLQPAIEDAIRDAVSDGSAEAVVDAFARRLGQEAV